MRDTSSQAQQDDKSIGELFHQLVDDGKGYAKAEVDLGKARIAAKVAKAKRPLFLAGAALVMALATIVAMVDFTWVAISIAVGPVWGGLITFLLFAAVTALLGRRASRAFGAMG